MTGPAGEAGWLPPMLAQPLRVPGELSFLRTGEWVFERKLDGLRCVAVRGRRGVELWSRNHLPFDRRFPDIARAVAAVPVDSFVLDGEIAAFEGDRTSFQLLQSGEATAHPVYVAFDLLFLLGRDTTGLPLTDRADLLGRTIGASGGLLRPSERLTGDAGELLRSACSQGWEGLVAKRATSPYRSGRSPDWRKLKCSARQELVIGGWSEPSGARTAFGALLMGYYQDGELRYAGKVGTGFDERTLRALYQSLKALETRESPFAQEVRVRGVHWVRPELVAEIEFTEWTRDDRMRHPSFLGLRTDKPASEVRRETPREGSKP